MPPEISLVVNRDPHDSRKLTSMRNDEVTRRDVLQFAAISGGAAALGNVATASNADGAGGAAAAPKRFAGKIALVTGATSGMGAVTAKALAVAGAQVVFCGRREAEGKAVAADIAAAGGAAQFIVADVRDEPQVKSMFEQIASRYGRLDFAFNNVGTSDGTAPLHELSTEYFDLVIGTNLRGNFLQMKYEIPLMLKNGGVILGNSSIAGLRYLGSKVHYTAAKHGVIGMYCAAAQYYADKKIRINVICPGLIKTEKAMRVLGGDEHKLDARIPMGHIGESLDVSAAVLWLFSDEARYITGAVLPVDGGQSVV